MRALMLPTLIMLGDEDDPCIEPSIFMKRCISTSGLVVFPQSGHAINLEEPDLFNRSVQDFLIAGRGRDVGAARRIAGGRRDSLLLGATSSDASLNSASRRWNTTWNGLQ